MRSGCGEGFCVLAQCSAAWSTGRLANSLVHTSLSSVVLVLFWVVRWCEFSMCQSVLIVPSIHSCDSSFQVHSDVFFGATPSNFSCVAQ